MLSVILASPVDSGAVLMAVASQDPTTARATSVWEIVTAIGTASAAVFAAVAAVASFLAIKQTRLVSQATLLSELLSEYAQPKMKNALRVLGTHRDTYGDDFVGAQKRHVALQWPSGTILDEARRYLSHYFFRVYRLREGKYIDGRFFEQIASLDGVAILLKVCEPLAKDINPEDRSGFFDAYREHWVGRADEHKVRPIAPATSERTRVSAALQVIRRLRLLEPLVRGLHSQVEQKLYLVTAAGVHGRIDEVERLSNLDRFESDFRGLQDHDLEKDIRRSIELAGTLLRLRRAIGPIDIQQQLGSDRPNNMEFDAALEGLKVSANNIRAVVSRLHAFSGTVEK